MALGRPRVLSRDWLRKQGYERCLYISQLKATIAPACRDIGFSYYLEKGEEDKESWCRSQNRIGITDKSLNVLFDNHGSYKRYQLVIIDEIERVAFNAIDPSSRHHELLQICRDADLVLMLDADVSEDMTLWYAEQIAAESTEETRPIYLHNARD